MSLYGNRGGRLSFEAIFSKFDQKLNRKIPLAYNYVQHQIETKTLSHGLCTTTTTTNSNSLPRKNFHYNVDDKLWREEDDDDEIVNLVIVVVELIFHWLVNIVSVLH